MESTHMDAQILSFSDAKTAREADEAPYDGPRTCDLCIHCMSSAAYGEYCFLYEEQLTSVHEADDCEDFEVM